MGKDVFLAPGALVLGDVEIGDGTNLWFYTVVRGDVHRITLGKDTNIQDMCMLHVTGGRFPLNVGNNVVVGHRVVLHGCTVHDSVLIGIGALVLDGAVVEEGAMVAAGAVVAPGTTVPANKLVMGIPARVVRDLTDEDRQSQQANAERYRLYAQHFPQWVTPADPWS